MPPPSAADSTLIANLRRSSLATAGTPRKRWACSVFLFIKPTFLPLIRAFVEFRFSDLFFETSFKKSSLVIAERLSSTTRLVFIFPATEITMLSGR